MSLALKPLGEQTIVVTGAMSGIGLAFARRAATAGARLVLAARDGAALHQAQQELQARGAQVEIVEADLGEEADVARLAEAAIGTFGGFDSWINNAGASIHAPLWETSTQDHKRLFATNYWGIIYGSLEAVRHLRGRPEGGSLINIGSILSDVPVPVQGAYVASKHAVKGFTDALRLDLKAAHIDLNVVLIKPSSVATPFARHARNHIADAAPAVPPPAYDPELVADALVYACENRVRDFTVGGAGKLMALLAQSFPRLSDLVFAKTMPRLMTQHDQNPSRPDGFAQPGTALKARGPGEGRTVSVYTSLRRHPVATLSVAGLAGLALATYLIRPETFGRRRSFWDRAGRYAEGAYDDARDFAHEWSRRKRWKGLGNHLADTFETLAARGYKSGARLADRGYDRARDVLHDGRDWAEEQYDDARHWVRDDARDWARDNYKRARRHARDWADEAQDRLDDARRSRLWRRLHHGAEHGYHQAADAVDRGYKRVRHWL